MTAVRIGALRLADSASLAVAQEWGLFEQTGVVARVSVEPSWANIADKLAYGLLDAAIMLPPLALAANMGLRGPRTRLVVPMGISQAGNPIVLASDAAPDARGDIAAIGRAVVGWLRGRAAPPPIAVVHVMSSHNLLLRHWLASCGGDPDRDMRTVVLPPDRVVEALAAGEIAGFCAGAPWGEVAEAAGCGRILLDTADIRPRHPEKCFAVASDWAAANPSGLTQILRGLRRAAALCDDPERGGQVAALLADGDWRMPRAQTRRALAGGGGRASIVFGHAEAARIRSEDGAWFAAEMRRWGWVGSGVDLDAAVRQTYRPDLADAAFVGEPAT